MHRCFKKADWSRMRLVVFFCVLTSLLGAADTDILEQAKARLLKSDPKGAVAILEGALPKTKPGDRASLLKQLRIAYKAAAQQAKAAGNTDEAQEYLDNLEILSRMPAAKPRPVLARETQPASSTPPISESEPDAAIAIDPAPQASPPGGGITLPLSPGDAPKPTELPKQDLDALRSGAESKPPAENLEGPPDYVAPKPDPGAVPAPTAPRQPPKPGFLLGGETPSPAEPEAGTGAEAEPKAVPTAPVQDIPVQDALPVGPKSPTLKDADAAFVGKRYDEANSIYRGLAQARELPENRRDHWAYCRAVEVVRKINAKPTTAKEWADIDAEIDQIAKLSPKNWFAEYLRDRAAERNPQSKAKVKTGANDKKRVGGLLVRGASPDEEADEPRTPQPQPVQPAGDAAPIETANFRVIHNNRALAERLAKEAETARQTLVTRWTGQLAAEPWTPRCDIFLYSSAESFSAETGQPKDSPGFSTMGMNSGRIVSRRINLRADHPNVIKAILPHEVTHVVLADLFPTQQIPRWADEGLSVLSEPASEQAIRAAELEEPLATGRLFRLPDLMQMDYPDNQYWGLYYAQSVSLTRFLVDQGTPQQFVTFVKASQLNGAEAALKQVYKIKGNGDLQVKWLAYAKSKSAQAIASTSNAKQEKK